jgi:hypothetical protein
MEGNKMEAMYAQCEKAIHKAVWYCAKKYNTREDDLLCEANFIFVEAFQGWREEEGPFIKRLNFKLYRKLPEFCYTMRAKTKKNCTMEGVDVVAKEEKGIGHILAKLGKEARMLVEVALSAPEELSREILIEKFADLGWTEWKTSVRYREVKEALRTDR